MVSGVHPRTPLKPPEHPRTPPVAPKIPKNFPQTLLNIPKLPLNPPAYLRIHPNHQNNPEYPYNFFKHPQTIKNPDSTPGSNHNPDP